MKEKFLICLVFLLAVNVSAFTQQPNSRTDKEYLLLKSKHQNTGAWILLGGGAALTAVGLAIGVSSVYNELGSVITTGKDDHSFVAGEAVLITGFASMAGSIPLFIASARNKRRAMETVLTLKMESRPKIENRSIYSSRYPAMSIKFSLP